ncbi:MAG: hypothetical protein FWC72_03460 [Oscillospiraceae bacterium]|nr:hypothetical protein [Oscillospiraceae bacterium]
MDLYKQIFLRQSCRKYEKEPLSEAVLAEIEAFIGGMRPLFPEVAINHRIVGAREIKGMMAIKAPHYVAISGKGAPYRDLCAGFLFQQLDLYLSARGLGACWLGVARGRETPAGEEEILSICFGTPVGPATRSLADFKRKTLAEIALEDDPRLEAARLAPSGMNTQPWHFKAADGVIHVYQAVPGKLKALLYSFQELDLGIALCHLMLATEAQGGVFGFERERAGAPAAPPGFVYLGSVV